MMRAPLPPGTCGCGLLSVTNPSKTSELRNEYRIPKTAVAVGFSPPSGQWIRALTALVPVGCGQRALQLNNHEQPTARRADRWT
jgi:hypothetical protein